MDGAGKRNKIYAALRERERYYESDREIYGEREREKYRKVTPAPFEAGTKGAERMRGRLRIPHSIRLWNREREEDSV